jgi:hypothetical protein
MPNPLRKMQFGKKQNQRKQTKKYLNKAQNEVKPKRTAPSSRVKKIVKEGNDKFVGPLSQRYYDGQENYRRGQQYEDSPLRGKEARKRVMRKDQAEYAENSSESFDRRPQNIQSLYYQLRQNLSPANARLLDILAGKGGPDFEDGLRKYDPEDVIPF